MSRTKRLQPCPQEPIEGREVIAQGAGVGCDDHAPLPQDRVAGEADATAEKGEVVRRMTGGGDRAQGPDLISVPQLDLRPARSSERRTGKAGLDLRHRLAVVRVVMGQKHGAEATPPVDFVSQRL
jgi:hypothetical protein